MTAPLTYNLTYSVQASTFIGAVMAAGGMLRTGVHVIELLSASETVPGWWEVRLRVEERLGEPPMPLFLHEEFPDHDPDATYWTEGRP
jgi:hypothetical protein